jgi:hypothetical protein
MGLTPGDRPGTVLLPEKEGGLKPPCANTLLQPAQKSKGHFAFARNFALDSKGMEKPQENESLSEEVRAS